MLILIAFPLKPALPEAKPGMICWEKSSASQHIDVQVLSNQMGVVDLSHDSFENRDSLSFQRSRKDDPCHGTILQWIFLNVAFPKK